MIELPSAFVTDSDSLPYADDWANTPGVRLKLLMADIEGAKLVVRIRFAPGILLPPHKHTLKVADHNTSETDVVFVVCGAMIHYGPSGEILAVGDAESHLRDWPAALRAQGKPVPATLPVGGAMRYRALTR